ncbi:Phosphate transport system permease protein PstA [Phycisphaerae bacterium RAS1]|nr:Phosphate transport system permease protein PstA [Phycisphaerae bacterium RAS1]
MSVAAARTDALYAPRLGLRRVIGFLFALLCAALSLVAVLVLMLLLGQVLREGWALLRPEFLRAYPSNLNPERAGIRSALLGTIWLMALTALIAVPVGVGAAVYLNEYSRPSRINRFIQLNIANLAGVPSIVYGMLGLALFVRWMHLGQSVLAGALTMTLLILPVIIIASREALAAVPGTLREAAFGLGATRWQTVRHHVLPAALPGIMTGTILALSRAIGETAPLILIGAVSFVRYVPGGELSDYAPTLGGLWDWFSTALGDGFTVLPLQIYNWTERPQPIFHELAASSIIVLLGILLSMNAVAAGIRAWQQTRKL